MKTSLYTAATTAVLLALPLAAQADPNPNANANTSRFILYPGSKPRSSALSIGSFGVDHCANPFSARPSTFAY